MSCLYENDASNWLHSCQVCFDGAEEMWREQFADYYAGLL